jgi:hypothetical protein
MKKLSTLSFGFVIVLGSITSSHSQSILASGTISGSPDPVVSGDYDYTLTLTALPGSIPINSLWFAWTPGNFYLASAPGSITGGDGWTGSPVSTSIQFVDGTPISAGNTETFHFVNTDTPTQMANEVGPAHSVAYSGQFSGSSETIGVQSVPEPSVLGLLTVSAFGFGSRLLRRKH